MLDRRTFHGNEIVIVSLITTMFVVACNRQKDRDRLGVPASAWAAEASFAAEDRSKADADYVALGITTPESNWTSEDMRVTSDRLRELAASHPEALPRHRSSNSGKLFARITSQENLAVLKNPAAPASIRLPAALAYTHALNVIYELYADALRTKRVAAEDVVELQSARLHACQVLLELVDEYIPELANTDPKRASRMEGIEAIRRSTSDVVQATLHALSDPQSYGLSVRRRLLDRCLEVFPRVAPKLPLEARQHLLVRLRELSANPNLGNLQPALSRLRDEVARAIERVETAP